MKVPADRKNILCYLFFAAICLFLFRDIVFGGKRLFGSDFVAFYLSIKQFFYHEIHRHHSIPFWNPYIFGGIPFWAHFESTLFYPLGFLYWILSPERAYGYTLLLHLALGGSFMFFLCRSFQFSRPGSLAATLVFSLNGFFMATLYAGQMFRLQAYIWIPLIVYFTHRSLTSRPVPLYASLAGLLWGVQILAGAPQDAFYTFLALVLFAGCTATGESGTIESISKAFGILGIIFLVGAGISAIQTVPAFEYIGQSIRSTFDSYSSVTIGSYPPKAMITAFMPHFYGNFTKGDYWISGVPWTVPLYNVYIGILPLILLFFLSFRRSSTRKILIFSLSLALFSLLMAFGSHTPLYHLMYHLPGFDRIRAPSKIIVLWVFAFALLAGKGMDDLFENKASSLSRRLGMAAAFISVLTILLILFSHQRSFIQTAFSIVMLEPQDPSMLQEASQIIFREFSRLTLFCLCILLWILLWIRFKFNASLAAFGLCFILLFDLAYVNHGSIPQKENIYHWISKTKDDLNRSIGKDKTIYRVGSFDFGMGPNLEMYFGYQTIGGYTPLVLCRFHEYINTYTENGLPEGWISFSYGRHKSEVLMDLLNVKYEISYAERRYALRKSALPRAFIVPEAKIAEKDDILKALVRPDFDPREAVYLEQEDAAPEPLPSVSGGAKTGGDATITSYRPDRITLETNAASSGFLFLSEIAYPGWKAEVDGKRARIFRGNYLFRTIRLPKGRHLVRFVFDPLSIKIGTAVTLITLLALAILLARHWTVWRKRHRSHPAGPPLRERGR